MCVVVQLLFVAESNMGGVDEFSLKERIKIAEAVKAVKHLLRRVFAVAYEHVSTCVDELFVVLLLICIPSYWIYKYRTPIINLITTSYINYVIDQPRYHKPLFQDFRISVSMRTQLPSTFLK